MTTISDKEERTMPRPTTKDALCTAAQTQWEKLQKLIETLTAEEQEATFDFGSFVGKESHWERDNDAQRQEVVLQEAVVHQLEDTCKNCSLFICFYYYAFVPQVHAIRVNFVTESLRIGFQ